MKMTQRTAQEPYSQSLQLAVKEKTTSPNDVGNAPAITWAAVQRRRRANQHKNSFSDLMARLA